jgi:hypothetical protein
MITVVNGVPKNLTAPLELLNSIISKLEVVVVDISANAPPHENLVNPRPVRRAPGVSGGKFRRELSVDQGARNCSQVRLDEARSWPKPSAVCCSDGQ